jgi:hypothetical protein
VFGKIRIRTGAVQLRHADPPQLTTTQNKKRKSRHTPAPSSLPTQPISGDETLSSPAILSTPRRAVPKIKSDEKLRHLHEFNKTLLGDKDYDVTAAALGELFYSSLTTCNDVLRERPAWQHAIPPRARLFWHNQFGQPDLNHSFAQEDSFKTTLLHTLCSGFLDPADTESLLNTHPLVGHLASAKVAYSDYDFHWLTEYNPHWEAQLTIDRTRQDAMTACRLLTKSFAAGQIAQLQNFG